MTGTPKEVVAAQSQPAAAKHNLWLWKIYVGAFLVIFCVVAFGFGKWAELSRHWPMSVVMTFGSPVAGSTPLAGGTVAFPILVLAFHQPASNARNFGLMIQALGMTAAMLFTIGRGVKLPVNVLTGSTAGAAIGFCVGNFLIAPHVQASLVKLLFACLWMSFALLTLSKNSEICALKGKGPGGMPGAGWTGLAVGVIGGALASIVGVALHVYLGDIDHKALFDWLAAGPIVIFGAPIGAYLGSIVSRGKVLFFVSLLCVLQFVWNLQQTAHSSVEWWFTVIAMTVAVGILSALYRVGKRAAQPAAG